MPEFKKASSAVILHNFGRSHLILGYSLKHGDWEIPGGKHEVGETSELCAVRETQEETGITLNLNFLNFEFIVETTRFITCVYSACIPISYKPEVMEKHKHKEWLWFPVFDLPLPFRDSTKEVLKKWLK